MLAFKLAVFAFHVCSSRCFEDLTFPPGFKFGVSSSAYQNEGAWNVSDKGENIWDRFVHENPHLISDRNTGDVACDSYHLWKRDIEMAVELGVHFYRFSISWTRLMPTGFHNRISEDGKNYYNNLIDGLLEKGIEPLVTMYHFDLPQRLQNLGGWANPLMSDWFASYARVLFSLYADRVKTWITINEPIGICDAVYSDMFAPSYVDTAIGPFLCNKYVLIAHAKAWRIYDEEFKPKYNGQVSIANNFVWIDPLKEEDSELAELAIEHMGGRFGYPIYSKKGGWPPAIVNLLSELAKKQGYESSNLPILTEEEIELIKGTYDFYALNHYTSRLIRKAKEGEVLRPWPLGDAPDLNAVFEKQPDWKVQPGFPLLYMYPEGLRRQLAWCKKQYGDIMFLITEIGFANLGGLYDIERMKFYRDYFKQVLLSIKEDGVNVTGLSVWTLMDNFEWRGGYGPKFGLYEVNFSSPLRTRTPRASAHYYKSIIQSHSLDVPMNYTKELYQSKTTTCDIWNKYTIIYLVLAVAAVLLVLASVYACYAQRRNASTHRNENYMSVRQ